MWWIRISSGFKVSARRSSFIDCDVHACHNEGLDTATESGSSVTSKTHVEYVGPQLGASTARPTCGGSATSWERWGALRCSQPLPATPPPLHRPLLDHHYGDDKAQGHNTAVENVPSVTCLWLRECTARRGDWTIPGAPQQIRL